jgi:hypothetical protein
MANGTTLMTTTLPTIVGAHVVSSATETMFGKGKRRATSRRAKPRVGGRVVHQGKRGGKYIMKKGRRVYI